ncbi:MAG TPA: ATP-dependent sacrificial sulfur transferase LarE [Nitrospira sp.]|nr:ATP-dependent sacrificial sulfur transferase LarE [Nitrospira sp.]
MQPLPLQQKLQHLRQIFSAMDSVLVAYSGGIDSTVVLKVAYDQLKDRAAGITALSPTFPASELEVAKRVAREIGVRHELVQTDQLQIPAFAENDATRCFHCKSDLYQLLGALRDAHAGAVMVDGTNLDDLGDDRPGIKAAREWGVRSPLVEAGLSKAEIRTLAHDLGLSNWDKPAAACLSSRIPRGIPITREKLSRIEQAEAVLQSEGFRHYRVRDHGEIARIEVGRDELARLIEQERGLRVSRQLKELGFRFVTIDLEGYRPGGISLGSPRPAR